MELTFRTPTTNKIVVTIVTIAVIMTEKTKMDGSSKIMICITKNLAFRFRKI